jgi:HlyD family secretion protein
MKRWIVIAVAVIVIVAGVIYFGPLRRRQQAAAQTQLQTVPAGRGNLTATVGATGIVHANQSAELNWQTTGTIGEVMVSVGEAVQRDQVLAALEQTSLPQTVILAQADLVSAQKALDELKNSTLQQAQAQQALDQAQKALDDARSSELAQANAQQALAAAQKAVENAERLVRNYQSPASQSYIDEAQAQVTIAKDRLDKAKEKYQPYANKSEDNLTRAQLLSEVSKAQQQYDLAVRNLNSLQGTAGASDQAVAQANLAQAQAQLAEAQREWERVKDGPSPAQVSLLEAQLADAQRQWERVKDGPDPDDLAAAEARVAAAQAALNQANLTAPFAGTVTEVSSKPGDQAAPGVPAFRIDDLSRLLVDVEVSEVDINRIKVGQEVSLIFDAIPNQEYRGIVKEVAPVGTTEEGVVDFTVTAELSDPDEAVRPGMTAAANIVVDQLEDVLLVPNRAVRVREGSRVVYVLKEGTTQPVEITLGASSDTDSQVLAGELKEGDLIVLNPPLEFEGNGPPPFVR